MSFLNSKLTLAKANFYIFCFSIILLRLPPFLVMFDSPFSNSHSIARYLLIFPAFYISCLVCTKNLRFLSNNKPIVIILLFFIAQSLSVFGASNIQAFLLTYKDLVFGISMYIVGSFVVNSKKEVDFLLFILLISTALSLIYQSIIYFFPHVFINLLEPFIYGKYLQVFDINFPRQKYFIDIFDTALMPIIFYVLMRNRQTVIQVIGVLEIISISFFAFVSNFRVHLLMLTLSLLGVAVAVLGGAKKRFLFISIYLFIILMAYLTLLNFNMSTSLKRATSPSDSDYLTIQSRVNLWGQSIEMAASSPFFGVGLGNFYDALPHKNSANLSLSDPKNELERISHAHPHNFFFQALAETGLIGLTSLILLVSFFAYLDRETFVSGKRGAKLLVISFWSLFSFGLVTPANTPQYISLFWLLRVLIDKLKYT